MRRCPFCYTVSPLNPASIQFYLRTLQSNLTTAEKLPAAAGQFFPPDAYSHRLPVMKLIGLPPALAHRGNGALHAFFGGCGKGFLLLK